MEPRVLTDPELEALGRLEELCERAHVNHRQRLELRAYPILAVELLSYALGRGKIRNPAAYAVSRFRLRIASELREQELEEEHEAPTDAPPLTLEELTSALALARKWNAPAAVIAGIEHELDNRPIA